MMHSELVQLSTDFLAEVQDSARWLPQYDAALASASDNELTDLVEQLTAELHRSFPVAA